MASGIYRGIYHGVIRGLKHNALVMGGVVAPTPTFQAVGSKAEGIGDVTVNWPAHVTNDVALLFVETNGTEAAVLGTPAGFVEVPGSPQHDDAGGNQTRLTVFWCRASSGAMASPVITDPGDHCEAVIITYRGCRTFDVPYAATAGSTTGGVPSTSISVPGAATGAPNCRVIIAIANGGGWDASAYANANLTGITERFDDFTGLAGAGGLSIADGAYVGPGDYGSTTATIGALQTCAFMSIALTGSSGSGESSLVAALTTVGTPINAARIWTTGLSDDNRMVLQAYNYPNEVPTEWFVLNLNTGTSVKVNGPNRTPANSNFGIGNSSTSSDATGGNQLRASNGRIFFPCAGLNMAYYDPTTKTIAHLTPPTDSGNTHAIIYSMQFGKDGMLYGSTQTDSGTGSLPAVVKLDPATLSYTLIGHVGTAAPLLYGYYTVAEYDGSYVYVAVGQDPWELWKIHVATGVAAKLTPSGFAGPYTHIEFEDRPEGWDVVFTNGASQARYWVADGSLYAGAPAHNPSDFTARDVTPAGPAPLVSAPEIEFGTASQGTVLWRIRGSGGAYTTVNFSPTTAPIVLDGLVELSDTDQFMSASQYGGYSRYDGVFTNQTTGLVSQPVFAEQGTWFSGYPNGALYEYNPSNPWNPGTNPVLRGNYNGGGLLSDMKYPYFLQKYAGNNRLYCVGRRERSGVGTGIGYYDITGASFAGHHTTPLDLYDPRGLLVLGAENRVVVSGESLDGVTPAKLLMYDLSLSLTSQLTVNSNINTGLLFGTGETARLVGVTETGAYRYNLDTGAIISQTALGFTVTAATQRASDNAILVAGGGKLVSIDPLTLVQTELIRGIYLDYAITGLSWVGSRLYAIAGPTLYRLD